MLSNSLIELSWNMKKHWTRAEFFLKKEAFAQESIIQSRNRLPVSVRRFDYMQEIWRLYLKFSILRKTFQIIKLWSRKDKLSKRELRLIKRKEFPTRLLFAIVRKPMSQDFYIKTKSQMWCYYATLGWWLSHEWDQYPFQRRLMEDVCLFHLWGHSYSATYEQANNLVLHLI